MITLIALPFLLAIGAFIFFSKRIAILTSLIPLLYLIFNHHHWIGTTIAYPWFPQIGVTFHLAIDSLSLLFLYLTAIIIPISLIAVPKKIPFAHYFFGFVFLLEGFLFLFFTARDLVVFTIFWEAMLLPLYFIINIWGGKKRKNASLKFLIYMFAGSVLMITGVLFLYLVSQTFNFDLLAQHAPQLGWLFGVFLLAFAVKTPLFPFHAWLPDAYYEAPTAGTILLSAILSKAGIYGILRIGIGFFPLVIQEWSLFLLSLSIIGVLYGGLAAWMQQDFKRLIAYSSFSHVNFVLAGLFVWSQTAHIGAVLQAINHGITIAALFLVAGWLQERLNSTSFSGVSGLAHYFPRLCWFTLFFVLSAVALPGTNNFVGEILILFGLFEKNAWLASLLALTVILSVIYMLRFMQKIYFEESSPFKHQWFDIKKREAAIALALATLILWIGIYPNPLFKLIKEST